MATKKKAKRTTRKKSNLPAGISRIDQIKYAVLERNGSISIIPSEGPPAMES